MADRDQAQEAVARYGLCGGAGIVRQLDATHAAFQVKAGDRLYALRQFNAYTKAENLRTQFLLAELMQNAGLRTPLPVPAPDGEPFVEVQARLWSLFPWCHGRPGRAESIEDLAVLTSVQGAWVECCERLRSGSRWDDIVRSAEKSRQRKGWAWVVPLDQVPAFAREHAVIERARAEAPAGPHRTPFLQLLPEVEAAIDEFDGLLEEHGVCDLPHVVTHGDFWASNIRISGSEAVVLDLDCFSFEPRIADFARAANWYYRERSATENAHLFRRFQARARLGVEEAEALPLMMCAHDLYYAVGHVLLFLCEEEPAAQSRLVRSIQSEARAAQRYRHGSASVLRMFLSSV